MSVYGVGAYYNTDVTKDFIDEECMCIGYNKEESSPVYEILRRVKIGDIVYIKSFNQGKKGDSGTVFIKAIGFVVGRNIREYNFPNTSESMGYGRKVIWKKVFEGRQNWIEIELQPQERLNNVYSNTLYEEYSPRIIKEIINLV